MTGKLSKNFHGVGIGPLSNILAVNSSIAKSDNEIGKVTDKKNSDISVYSNLLTANIFESGPMPTP